MLLETMSIGLIIPILAIITDPELFYSYELIKSNFIEINHGELIIYTMIALGVFFIIKTIILAIINFFQLKIVWGINVITAKKLYTKYIRSSYEFHFKNNSSILIRNIVNEVDKFSGSINALVNLFSELIILIGIFILLFYFQPLATISLLMIFGVSSTIFYLFIRNYIDKWGQARQIHQGRKIQYIQQGIGAIKDIKILNRESNFINRFSYHNQRIGIISMLENFTTKAPRLWLEMIAVMSFAFLVIILVLKDFDSSSLITTLGLFAGAAFRSLPSINRIMGSLQGIKFSAPAIKVINDEILNIDFDNKEVSNQEIISNIKYLKVDNVSFSYNNIPQKTLEDININIPFGASVGIIGPSGSGKSTLIDLIMGLINPDKGKITVDGVDIHKNKISWQKNIGYVAQSIYMTDDSIKNNIAFGLEDEDIDVNLVQNAIKLAQLDDLIKSLPNGIHTSMGERGIRLSGGQLQRIGIARALYYNPSILILDEATSSLDIDTERKIMTDVLSLRKDKIIIIITHRISTIENCELIYKIENGNLIK
ncbi:ABC transporter ATP-binding protein/permease [bacterium]|nr:ABC transporter ATP-binding protein/permease [bacterium]